MVLFKHFKIKAEYLAGNNLPDENGPLCILIVLTKYMAYNLPSLHYIYSVRVIGVVDLSNCSSSVGSQKASVIFVKAKNIVIKMHLYVADYDISTTI